MAWYDFDAAIPHIPSRITTGRQWLTEYWLQRALEHQARGQDIGVCGQMVYGEILAAPSAPLLAGLAVCLLDCADMVRMDRLRALHLPPGAINIVSQQMLNWASWLRMHAVDPQWEPETIRATGPLGWRWECWATWRRGDPRWQVWTLDTTALTVPDVVAAVADWVERQRI